MRQLGLLFAVLLLVPRLSAEERAPLSIALVGDSTMASYDKPPPDRPELTGWGQVFDECFREGVTVLNHARSGRSSKSFIREGAWKLALEHPADYVFIQFGHNDQPGKGDRSTEPEGDFRDFLRQYIDEARAAKMIPVLVTPVARRTYMDGKIQSTLGPYADAVQHVGREQQVPVIDLHAASLALFDHLGDDGSIDLSASVTDRTHFSRKGAQAVARLVADAIPTVIPELTPYLLATTQVGKETVHAKFVARYGYQHTVELQLGEAKAVLCPDAGGRVLEFSWRGTNALYLDPQEVNRQPGQRQSISAGRFDIGPELTTAPHPKLWSGEWTAEITGDASARLTSPRDEATGIQLRRDFELRAENDEKPDPCLICKQTIINVSNEVREYCHWGRSFSPGSGICLIPLAGRSRFPSKYAMYEDSAIINVKNTDDLIRERDGFLEILAPPRKPKLGFDSTAGSVAYVMPSNLMLVKTFATYPDRVYNEAAGLTLSVWFPKGPQIELEPIGPREVLKPGESAAFTEEWWLVEHPFPKTGESLDLGQVKRVIERLKR